MEENQEIQVNDTFLLTTNFEKYKVEKIENNKVIFSHQTQKEALIFVEEQTFKKELSKKNILKNLSLEQEKDVISDFIKKSGKNISLKEENINRETTKEDVLFLKEIASTIKYETFDASKMEESILTNADYEYLNEKKRRITEINNEMQTPRDNQKERFSFRELPFEQFKKLGFTKESLLNLPKEDMKNMLSGEKTGLLSLSVSNQELTFKVDGKLSLLRNNDNTISLKVHPYRKEIENSFNLDKDQLKRVKKGDIIEISFEAKNGQEKKHLIQLDKAINELVGVLKDNVRPPSKVKDIVLSEEQKNQFAAGKRVTLKGKHGELDIQLDLNDRKGIKVHGAEAYEKNSKLDKGTVKGLSK